MTQHGDVDEEDVAGKSMFGFKTPRRTKYSAVQPLSSQTKKSKKEAEGKTYDTDEEVSSSSVKRSRRQVRKVQATTPYRLALRMDPTVDSDNSIDSEDSDVDSVQDNHLSGRTFGHNSLPTMTDEFFKAQTGKSVTSNHTLARLREDGILDHLSLSDILSSRPNQYKKDVRQLLKEHQTMFQTWMLQLCLGFNLLLYGYGSKKGLIEEFRKSVCSQYHCVVINGFFPSLTLRNILWGIAEECLGLTLSQLTDTDAIVTQIHRHLYKKDEALFIFVHNIDGPMLRGAPLQSALASLASHDNIHLLASIDHINAPLMWTQSTIAKYKWIWYDATTFDPYIEETSYENSLMTQQTGTLALRSMCNVFKSLTPNAKNIFLLMARYHTENSSNPAYIGIPFQILYQKCREGFLVNSDQTLRTQLTEFRDHKLVKSRKGADGAEHLFLPIDPATLNDFMEQIENIDA
ncbi:origin recognition complex subunit 2-like isoform X2 [Watersipora subatra]